MGICVAGAGARYKVMVINFYAPWCHWCKLLVSTPPLSLTHSLSPSLPACLPASLPGRSLLLSGIRLW